MCGEELAAVGIAVIEVTWVGEIIRGQTTERGDRRASPGPISKRSRIVRSWVDEEVKGTETAWLEKKETKVRFLSGWPAERTLCKGGSGQLLPRRRGRGPVFDDQCGSVAW